MNYVVIGTLPGRPRPNRLGWGDHVTYDGQYAGIIVDVDHPHDSCLVAHKKVPNKESVTAFRLSSLARTHPRNWND